MAGGIKTSVRINYRGLGGVRGLLRFVSFLSSIIAAGAQAQPCELYPIALSAQSLDGVLPGTDIQDIHNGMKPGNFGWLTWDPASSQNNANYAVEEMMNTKLSMKDFTDTTDPNDDVLQIGSHVSSGPGVMNSDDVDDQLEALRGKTIRVPIYNKSTGTGGNVSYTVSHFALITINDICLPRNSCPGVSGSDKLIKASFVKYEDDACGPGPMAGEPGNHRPEAVDDNVTTPKNTAVVIDVLANDKDLDGDTLSVISVAEVTIPFKGNVQISGSGTTVTYTPHSNDTGTYIISYTINDGKGGADKAEVTVQITN